MKKLFSVLILILFCLISTINLSIAGVGFKSSAEQNKLIAIGKIFKGMNWKQYNKTGGLGGASYGIQLLSKKGNYVVDIQDLNIYIFKKKPGDQLFKFGFASKKPILVEFFNDVDPYINYQNAKKFIKEKEGFSDLTNISPTLDYPTVFGNNILPGNQIISILEKGPVKKKEEKKIAEKPKDTPKKKTPKPSPDDDKIVPAGSGSGFFVSKDGHAITNYHVVEGCDINKLSFKGSQTEVKVLAVDKVNDIAILKSNAKPDVIFPVSNEDVSLLEDVIVAGFPLGKQISSAIKTHKGVVTALAGAGDNYSFFQTDAAINQGNSGGPIINQKGNVVGIAVATWVEEGVQGVHFGIKSSVLKTFASANELSFSSPNYRDLSNKDLGKLITKGTVYVECHMTVAKIKKMIAQAENRKAFFKEHK